MEKNLVFSQGLKTGLIAAAVAIVTVLIAFILNITMIGWTFQGISYILLIAVMIYGLLQFRKANGGFMAFAQGLLVVLVAGVVCSVISYFFNLLYFNLINPDYINEVMEYSKEAVQKMGMVMNDELEATMRANAEKSMHFSILNFTIGIVGSLVIWSILGSILGAIFSKKDPSAIA